MPQSSIPNPALDPIFSKKKRVYIACLHCRKRKIRCITNEATDAPCLRCIEKGLDCKYAAVANERGLSSGECRRASKGPTRALTLSFTNTDLDDNAEAADSRLQPSPPPVTQRSPKNMRSDFHRKHSSASSTPRAPSPDLPPTNGSHCEQYGFTPQGSGYNHVAVHPSLARHSPRAVQNKIHMRSNFLVEPSPSPTDSSPQVNVTRLPSHDRRLPPRAPYAVMQQEPSAYGYDVRPMALPVSAVQQLRAYDQEYHSHQCPAPQHRHTNPGARNELVYNPHSNDTYARSGKVSLAWP